MIKAEPSSSRQDYLFRIVLKNIPESLLETEHGKEFIRAGFHIETTAGHLIFEIVKKVSKAKMTPRWICIFFIIEVLLMSIDSTYHHNLVLNV